MYQIGNLYIITAIAVVGGALFGFDIASMSAIIAEPAYKCYFNQLGMKDGKCLGPNSSTQGGITSAMPGGSYVGALLSGWLTDWLGRRRAIMIGCAIWIVGSTLACAAQNIGMLVVGRFICGLCVGIASAQVPVYISELSPPTKRGRFVGTQQWAITWGIMIMFYISYGTSFLSGNLAWRLPWGLQMIPAVFLFISLIFMPESPRWLGKQGRWDEAHQVLVLVHGKGDPNHVFVQKEFEEIKAICEFEKANADVTWLEILNRKNINRTHIGVFTQIWSQLTGMNVMMYYITYVFTMAGKSSNNLLLSSSIQYIINVVMTVPALLYMDKWGRRPTLLVGAILMATWMFANAGILSIDGHRSGPNGYQNVQEATYYVQGAAANALIACTYLFVASYAPTWGPVSWVYPPELYPLRTRGKSVALATSGNWIFNFALGYFVPPSFTNIGWRTYCVFGVFNLAMFVHVFFLFPETAGKTLEETKLMFEDPNGIKYIGTPAWKTKKSTSVMREAEKGANMDIMNRNLSVGAGETIISDSDSADKIEKSELQHVTDTSKAV